MLDKEGVIRRICEENWDEFEIFVSNQRQEYDEFGFNIYYIGYVKDFIKHYNIKSDYVEKPTKDTIGD